MTEIKDERDFEPRPSSNSSSKLIDGLSALKKRTLRIDCLIDHMDFNRVIYPNGVFGAVTQSAEDSPPVKRIELFAEERNRDLYGIIRDLFVAYSSEAKLLEMAQASNSVVSVRTIDSSNSRKTERRIIEDKLVLRRSEVRARTSPYKKNIADLMVTPRWLERMDLEKGDRVIISNPIENYVVPPPNVAKAL